MNKLEHLSVKKLLVQLIVPSLVTALVSGSYNLVDGIFIGQSLGIKGNSANTYTFMIYALIYGFSALASEGTASLLTIALGEHRLKKAQEILNASISISVILSLIQACFIFFSLEYLFVLFGTPVTLYAYIKEFCTAFLIGSPVYFVSHTLLYCLRAQGKVKQVLLINVISFLVNVCTGAFFILGMNLGFIGSALSTILANVAILLLTIREYHGGKSSLRLNLDSIFRAPRYLVWKIVSMGMPFFLTTTISVGLLVIYNRIALMYAATFGLAALSIVSSLYRYIISLMNAITDGVQPIVSFNYGAGKYQRVQEALIFSLLIGTVFSIILFIPIQFYAEQIIRLFNPDSQNFVRFGSEALRIVMLSLPLQGFINIGTNYFQYVSLSRISTFLVIFRQIILQLPLAFLLPILFQISGLWISYFPADILVFFAVIILLYRVAKK